jgi:LysM repeat protein
MSNYAQATAPTATAYQFHVIEKGDTLEKIVQRYNMGSVGALRNFNMSLGNVSGLEGFPQGFKYIHLWEL